MRLFYFALLFASQMAFSQGTITVKNGTLSSTSNYSTMISYYNVKDGDVIILNHETTGSPYLSEDYELGTLYIDEANKIENVALKYNVYNDVFFAKESLVTPNEEAQGVVKQPRLKIMMGKKYFMVLPDTEAPGELHYYQIISTGKKLSLIKKHDKSYRPRIQATTSLTRDVPAIFRDREALFVMNAEGVLFPMPKSRKEILAFMKDKKEEIAEVVKNYDLNVKEVDDLMRLLRFYNSL